jgi:hypothetical protein
VDYKSQRLPLIETVQLFGFSHHAAELAVNAIKARDAEIAGMIGNPMKINGVGHERLCADLNAVIIVLQQLPNTERVRAYRRKCADDLVRQMKGDPTLVDQIAHNHSVLQHTGGIHFYENSMGNVTLPHPSASFQDIEYEERRFALEERRHALAMHTKQFEIDLAQNQKRFEMDMANQEVRLCIRLYLALQQIDLARKRKAELNDLGMLDDRCKSALRDSIVNGVSGADAIAYGNQLVCVPSAPLVESTQPIQVSEVMQYKLEMSADNVRKYAQGAGLAVANEYRARYGDDCEFLSTNRVIDGRIRPVKAYDQVHIDWIKHVITEYVNAKKKQTQKKVT